MGLAYMALRAGFVEKLAARIRIEVNDAHLRVPVSEM